MRILIVLLTMIAASAQAANSTSAALLSLEQLPYQQRTDAVDLLLSIYRTNPIHETGSDSLTLFYRGPGDSVRLAGDHTNWRDSLAFRHLTGTGLWYLTAALPRDGRLDYKLVVDGDWRLDPRNPDTCTGGFGPNSELRGQDYLRPAWIDAPAATACRLDTLRVESSRLGDVRTVVVAVPGGEIDGHRPFLIVHDGLEYLTLADLRHYLDVVGGTDFGPRLPICVCVPPVQRTAEYAESRQEAFGQFVTETLMPMIEERYADIGAVGQPWGSLGASYGGRITLDLARRYPARFDRLAPMSPSIAPEQHDGIAALPAATFTIYLNWGIFDIPDLIPGCERFDEMLTKRGISHTTEVLPQGHSWGLWRDTLDAAFHTLYSD